MAETTFAPGAVGASWLERVSRRPVLALLLLAIVAWLPATLALPPLDRDESRFAEASRQMVETGNYVDIRFAQTARYKKPIGIYWLQAASAKLFGPALYGDIRVYRLPSLVAGFLSLLLLFGLARAIAPPKAALLASLLLGSTLLFSAESVLATTDAVLLACVIGVQAVLLRVYLAARGEVAPSRGVVLAGWAALAIGMLVKGPVVLAVAGVTLLAVSLWDREWRWLKGTRPLTGVALAVVLVAPWAIAIGLASHGAFYRQSLGHDFAAKLLGGEESHGAPPGYYLALATFTFWPAILLLLPALGFAIAERRRPVIRYLLAWSGAAWLLFELVPTKLPHYILPAYPALALLIALLISRTGAQDRWSHILRRIGAVQFALAGLALTVACVWLPRRFGGWESPALFVGVGIALGAAAATIVLSERRQCERAAAFAIASACVFYVVLGFAVVPHLGALWLSPRAAALVAAHRAAHDPPVVLDGYAEPSLVFLLGADTDIEPRHAAGAASARAGGLALVEEKAQAEFLSDLRHARASAVPQGAVSGLDYSSGREQRITLYRVTATLARKVP